MAIDPIAASRGLRQQLRQYRRRIDFERDAVRTGLAQRVDALLDVVRHHTAPPPASSPPDVNTTLRFVHWNILHGMRFDAILEALQHEPLLAAADFISLNEVDVGLARSGNRDVAADLARALGMHCMWSPLFLELEGGYRSAPEIAAQPQREALFGLGILSRHALGQVRRVPLESPQAVLFDRERKLGEFIALIVEVLGPTPFHVVVTHLDVHRTPAARLRQVEQILSVLPPGPAVFAGDLNTTTFARGSTWRSLYGAAAIALLPDAALQRRLLEPQHPSNKPREPLFAALRSAGFEIDAFNQATPSLDLRLDDLAEVDALPRLLRRVASTFLQRIERRGRHRLDWITARGFDPVVGLPPFVLTHLMRDPTCVSDHAPIGCGLRLSAPPQRHV